MKIKRILKWSALAILLILFAWFEFAYWTSTNDCGRSIPAAAERMKAIRFCEYGSPDVLKLEEVEKPLPNDNELLVRVRAAALNAIDVGIVRGPLLGRLFFGLRKPVFTGFARDFAGVVEAVGNNVTEFKPGDEVFGLKGGAVAEYLCARKDRVVLKPANITFEQAGAVPLAGLTALQGLKTGKIHAGQKVLINGASGGGQVMSRIARAFGNAFLSRFTDQKFERYTTTANQADLKFLSELMAAGKVTSFVEKTYRLRETAEALRYFNEGHTRGKLVITVASDL